MQVYVTVASRWLLPRLHRFEAANPELRLRLSTSHRGWDFDAENADVGMIYREPPLEPDLVYWPLFRARLIAVANPAWSRAASACASRPSWSIIACSASTRRRATGDCWLDAAGVGELASHRSLLFDSYLLALEAAIDGQGVALVPDFVAAADLRAGRLVAAIRAGGGAAGRLVPGLPQGADRRSLHPAAAPWLIAEVAADPDVESSPC